MTVVRLRTEDLPRQDRFAVWYELTTHQHVPMIIDSEQRDDFWAASEMHDLGLMQLSRLSYAPLHGRRTPKLIRRSDPELLLVSLALEGTEIGERFGQERATGPGALAIFDTSSPGTVSNSTRLSRLVLQLPRSAVGERAAVVDLLRSMVLPADAGIGGVLAFILSDLARNANRYAPALLAQLSLTVVDLLGAAARLSAGTRKGVPTESRARMRQAGIHRYIRLRLGDPTLTPLQIAEAHGISVRQLNRDFQAEGAAPAEWIRRQRLERCRRDLLDPGQAGRSVVEVGARWGLPDPTTFNRCFRREFGLPPGEYRRRFIGSTGDLDGGRPMGGTESGADGQAGGALGL